MGVKKYDNEFRETAVKLAKEGKKPVKKLALELGISDVTLYEWIRNYDRTNNIETPKNGSLSAEQKEIIALKKELEDVKEEAAILKKAMAFFANPRK